VIDGPHMVQALVDYIKVERIEYPLEKVGRSLGDPLYVNSFVYPKRLYLDPFLSLFRDEVIIVDTRTL